MIFKHFLSIGASVFLNVSIFAFATLVGMAAQPQGIPFDSGRGYQVDMSKAPINTSSFSVAARVCVKDATPQIFIASGTSGSDFTLYLYNNNVRMLVEQDQATKAYGFALAPPPEPNTWTHYCGTYDGQKIVIYKDGQKVAEKPLMTTLKSFNPLVCLGTMTEDSSRNLNGSMDNIGVWNRALSAQEVHQLANASVDSIKSELLAAWNSPPVESKELQSAIPDGPKALPFSPSTNPLLNTKDSGFRSIWYYNQKLDNEYKFKYSGGLGTYPANHYPFAVYCPKVEKTFFCFGATDKETESTLYHEVSCFDHKTGMVCRPTIIIDKKTDDAHDNPVMTVDDEGFLWIFSTSHGTGRPSWIHKSVRPYDCSEFELMTPTKLVDGQAVPMTNFSYLQVFNVPGHGMVVFFTTYDKTLLNDPKTLAQRIVCFMSSKDGVNWSQWKPLAAIAYGHYQNGAVDLKSGKIGSTFNYHPNDPVEKRIGLNWRTNLYYMESNDFGNSWQSVQGTSVETPLKEINNPALVYDYEAERLNVYIMDLVYDQKGNPIIFYITSKGFESGPENGPRICHTARWTGSQWVINPLCPVDNNYDYGSLYIEQDGTWRVIGALDDGPQLFNTGGEMVLWTSKDEGKTWTKERTMTQNSLLNHCYPRRPINANPDFYSIWADGHGRQKSEASLYFSNQKGDVFLLPREMKDEWEKP